MLAEPEAGASANISHDEIDPVAGTVRFDLITARGNPSGRASINHRLTSGANGDVYGILV